MPSMLKEVINDRNNCSSETLGLREGCFSGAMLKNSDPSAALEHRKVCAPNLRRSR